MLKNYLRSAFRNLLKFKGFLIINLTGLSIGIACFLLISIYLNNELSFDRFNTKADRIVRLILPDFINTGKTLALAPAKAKTYFENQFPEIQKAARILTVRPPVISCKGDKFVEKKFLYADQDVFDIFSFNFIAGKKSEALTRANTCIITESAAKKYFGNENPYGRTVKVNDKDNYEITGIVKDFPQNSEIHFDFIASLNSLQWVIRQQKSWNAANFYTYFLLNSKSSIGVLQQKLDNLKEDEAGGFKYKLEPLTSIHLHSIAEPNPEPMEPYGDYSYFISMLLVGVLILLIAGINYMNLSTARSQGRAKEIGMRKMLGAERGQVIKQLYMESFMIVLLAVALSPVIAEILLPFFNSISGRNLALSQLGLTNAILLLSTIWIVVSLFSGSYPAIMLSSFKPLKMLRGTFESGKKGTMVRKVLIVFQFCVSFFLIAGTLIVYMQMNFVSHKKLGFDKDHLLVVSMRNIEKSTIDTFRGELTQNANVLSTAVISDIPGYMVSGYNMKSVYSNSKKNPVVTGVKAGGGILKTLGVDLLAGKDFPENYSPDNGYLFALNKAALGLLNLSPQDAINKQIDLNGRVGKIQAIVKNFNYASLRDNIYPLVIFSDANRSKQLLVRINDNDIKETVSYVKNLWNEMEINQPLNVSFMDQEFDALYKSEQRSSKMFTMLTLISLLVACLGLLGLSAYTIERRRKEIGVRKVLGASMNNLFVLLVKDFLLLILIAIVFGLPLVELIMRDWLNNFAYKINIGFGTILIAAIFTLLIAIFTISYQVMRASNANPVKTLRYE